MTRFSRSTRPYPHDFRRPLEHALDALDRLVALERDRFEQRKHPRRIVLVNSSAVFWEAYVLAQFDCSYTTPHSRVRRAAIKPVADHVATRTALVRGRRLIRWSMRAELGENGLRLRPGEIAHDRRPRQLSRVRRWLGSARRRGYLDRRVTFERSPLISPESTKANTPSPFSLGPVCATPDDSLDVELLAERRSCCRSVVDAGLRRTTVASRSLVAPVGRWQC